MTYKLYGDQYQLWPSFLDLPPDIDKDPKRGTHSLASTEDTVATIQAHNETDELERDDADVDESLSSYDEKYSPIHPGKFASPNGNLIFNIFKLSYFGKRNKLFSLLPVMLVWYKAVCPGVDVINKL